MATLSKADRNYWRDQRRTLLPEARDYAQIIQATLMRLGEFYAPATVQAHGKRAGGKRLQKVQFERVCLSPEIIYLKIRVHKRGWLGSKSALPHRVRLRDLMNDDTAAELSHACARKVTWECDVDAPERGAWYLIHRNEGQGGIPKQVSFMDTLTHYPSDMSSIPFVLGSGPHRIMETLYLGNTPHLLIAGPTGTGKSNAVNAFILAQMYHNAPRDVQFILIDLKGSEFRDYEKSPHLHQPVVLDVVDGLNVLNALIEEIKQRMEKLKNGIKDWATYRAKNPNDDNAPYLIVVIDEYAQFIFAHGPEAASRANARLIRIAAQGRAVGVQLIVCTQYPTGEVVNRQVKINLNSAIAFKCRNGAQSAVVLDVGDAANLPDVKGRALYTYGPYIREVQMAYVSPQDTADVMKRCIERYGEAKFETPVVVEPEPVKELPAERKPPEVCQPGEWFARFYIIDPDNRTSVESLYVDYCEYANAIHCVPVSKYGLGVWFNAQGFKTVKSHGLNYRLGVRKRHQTRGSAGRGSAGSSESLEMAGD
jgi:DNA polymerase III delta prime subunit